MEEENQDDDIPTIVLPSTVEALPMTVTMQSAHRPEEVTLYDSTATTMAVAELVVTASEVHPDQNDIEAGCSSTGNHQQHHRRAEFVSATFIKRGAADSLGVLLLRNSNDGIISSVAEGSLASASPLRVGDRIFSINNKQCTTDMDGTFIGKYLQSLVGRVTIVAHNQEIGTSNIVESMVTKTNPRDEAGLVLKTERNMNRGLVVSKLNPNKIFADSLLNIGDQVLYINGTDCRHLTLASAVILIQESLKTVTVVARTLNDTGIVVAEVSTRDGDNNTMMSPNAVVARARVHRQSEAATRIRNAHQQEPFKMTIRCVKRISCLLAGVAVIALVAVGIVLLLTYWYPERK